MGATNHQDLLVWQKSMDMVDAIYKETRNWPSEDLYGLVSQVRRAAVSIPANIAEGQGRQSDREFARFLTIAHGSLRELETHLFIAQRQGYLSNDRLSAVLSAASDVGKLINGLRSKMST